MAIGTVGMALAIIIVRYWPIYLLGVTIVTGSHCVKSYMYD